MGIDNNSQKLVMKIDKTIKELLNEISSGADLNTDDLIRSRVTLQLSRVSLALKLVSSILNNMDKMILVEKRMYEDEFINNLGYKDLFTVHNKLNKDITSHYNKVSSILGSLDISKLETSLLMIDQMKTNQQEESVDSIEHKKKSREMALKIMSQVNDLSSNVDNIVKGQTHPSMDWTNDNTENALVRENSFDDDIDFPDLDNENQFIDDTLDAEIDDQFPLDSTSYVSLTEE